MHIYIYTRVYVRIYDLYSSFSFPLPIISCIFSPDGLAAFRTFLKSEFSEENVEFWLACEDFKKTKSSAKIASKAQKIYSDFIQADAPKEVNSFLCVLRVLRMGINWKVQMQASRNNRKYNSMWLVCIFLAGLHFHVNYLPGRKHCMGLCKAK